MNYSYLVIALSHLISFLPLFFLICDYGEMVRSALDDMDELIYGMEWYSCPIELQKNLIVMLAVIRQQIDMKGLLSMNCSRFTFKRVNWCKISLN